MKLNAKAVSKCGSIELRRKWSGVRESRFEIARPAPPWIPDDLAAPGVIEKSIVGFEIKISDIKSKFKLNQTVSKASINGCIQSLLSQSNDTNKAMAEMMCKVWNAHAAYGRTS